MYSQHASRAERALRACAQHGDLAALQHSFCMPSGTNMPYGSSLPLAQRVGRCSWQWLSVCTRFTASCPCRLPCSAGCLETVRLVLAFRLFVGRIDCLEEQVPCARVSRACKAVAPAAAQEGGLVSPGGARTCRRQASQRKREQDGGIKGAAGRQGAKNSILVGKLKDRAHLHGARAGESATPRGALHIKLCWPVGDGRPTAAMATMADASR